MYNARDDRYSAPDAYRYAGKSGIKLPKISLGLWRNFGAEHRQADEILKAAFDCGICHFDVANNYGTPPGSAEERLGALLSGDFKPYRDELFISTKAGYAMWEGLYGNFGSKKSIVASCDQSLKRLRLGYVDLFYHHRFDPVTPPEETADALAYLVKSGRALYVGLANYPAGKLKEMCAVLKARKVPVLSAMTKYSLLQRYPLEGALQNVISEEGLGCVASCPLAQGLLTDRYLGGIPKDSRAAEGRFLTEDRVSETLPAVEALRRIATERGEPLSVTALAYVLQNPVVTAAMIGVSSKQQLLQNYKAITAAPLTPSELAEIDRITTEVM